MTLKDFFSTDPAYKEMTASYNKVDGILALALYLGVCAIYLLMGILLVNTGIYLAAPVNIGLIVICVLIVLARKQKLSSLGITAARMGRASLTGFIFGVIITLALNVIPTWLAGGRPISWTLALYNVFQYFIVIGLTEEVIFRGFIQTRLYGLINHDFIVILLTGILFYFMHFPFQAVVRGMQFDIVNMLVIVALHFIFNFLYRKYNSLIGPTIAHGVIDWGGSFLV